MHRPTLIIISAILLNGVSMLHAQDSFKPPGAIDSRFLTVHDKDHPWGFDPKFADRAAWEKRAGELRQQVLVSQGLWPMPEKTPLNAVVHGRIDRDEYTIEKVFFASMPGCYVTGNLYRPKNKSGKCPAVLFPYGHWPEGRFQWKDDNGVKKDIDSGAEIDPITARAPLQANCAMLARMGCVVFIYDMVGYSDSTTLSHKEGFLDAEAMLRLQSIMGLQTWNSIRAMDFVLGLPEVDAERVAIAGSSGGGTQSILLGSVDPRVSVSFPMVMISMNMQGGCVCENAPLARVMTNNVELASLIAPKPEGAAAANDWTVDFMTRGLPEMKKIWGLYGNADDVDGAHFDFGHNHNLHSRELQYAFNKHLKIGWPEPVREKPFEPVQPKELSAYDADHPRPADEADAMALRKAMTRASDEAMGKLAGDEYVKTVRVALQAMVVDCPATKNDVAAKTAVIGFPAAGGTLTGAIGRKLSDGSLSGEAVQFKFIFPKGYTNSVVIWADPGGTAALSESAAGVSKLLENGSAVLGIDWFMSDAFKPTAGELPTHPNRRGDPSEIYAAFRTGYERSVIANRVHDLLTAIAEAQAASAGAPVKIIAFKECGPIALLAGALAPSQISASAIDLNQFDFDRIHDDGDAMLLPGALKYGGIYGFVPLCDSGSTLLCNARETGRIDLARKNVRVTIDPNARDVAAMVDWLLKH